MSVGIASRPRNGATWLAALILYLAALPAAAIGPGAIKTPLDPRAAERLSNSIRRLLSAGDVQALAKSFRLSPATPPSGADAERTALAQHAGYVLGELGNPTGWVAIPELPTAYLIELRSGTAAEIAPGDEPGLTVRESFRVNYSKAGSGVARLKLVRSTSGWQLGAIEVGFPVDRPDARGLVAAIFRELVRQMNPEIGEGQAGRLLEHLPRTSERPQDDQSR